MQALPVFDIKFTFTRFSHLPFSKLFHPLCKCQDLLVTARDLMKDDIHNTVLVDSSKDRAVLLSLGDIQKALSENKKGVKVTINQFLCH